MKAGFSSNLSFLLLRSNLELVSSPLPSILAFFGQRVLLHTLFESLCSSVNSLAILDGELDHWSHILSENTRIVVYFPESIEGVLVLLEGYESVTLALAHTLGVQLAHLPDDLGLGNLRFFCPRAGGITF